MHKNIHIWSKNNQDTSSLKMFYSLDIIDMFILTKEVLQKAHQRIQPYIKKTPLESSESVTKISGCKNLYLKC